MKKLVGFIVGAGMLVAIGTFFMTQSDGWVKGVIDWANLKMGITAAGGILMLPFKL